MVSLPLAALLLALAGHPMHTSVAEIGHDRSTGEVRVAIRLYSDDLADAVPAALVPGADSALARYTRVRFLLADRTGRPVALTWAGSERAGDAVVLRLRGHLPGGLRGTRVVSRLLHERFLDQVNVVRVSEGGRTATLLFLRGDESRALP